MLNTYKYMYPILCNRGAIYVYDTYYTHSNMVSYNPVLCLPCSWVQRGACPHGHMSYVGASLLRLPLQRQSGFQARSLVSTLAWEMCFSSLHLSMCLWASKANMLLLIVAPGCSAMTVILSAVGLNCLLVHFPLRVGDQQGNNWWSFWTA